jgi:hypothetical protein
VVLWCELGAVAVGVPGLYVNGQGESGAAVVHRSGETHAARCPCEGARASVGFVEADLLCTVAPCVTCLVGSFNATPSWSSWAAEVEVSAQPTPPYVELFAPKPEAYARYGNAVSVSGDGRTLAIGSIGAGMSKSPVSTINRPV